MTGPGQRPTSKHVVVTEIDTDAVRTVFVPGPVPRGRDDPTRLASFTEVDQVTYRGRRIGLLTQHGKERVISPELDRALGCRVERVGGYDTDLMGTFTRDVPRAGTQLQAARTKARIGMELSGLPLGLASEGSFGPDPVTGMIPWNIELLILVDDELDLELIGVAQAETNFSHLRTKTWDKAKMFARKSGFPAHQMVVRPTGEDAPRIRKGIASWQELVAAFAEAQVQSGSGRVLLETDVRAHANPTRMENIRRAAQDLAAKVRSRCPACATPGFSIVERVAGLPCGQCLAPTSETREEVYRCLKCPHRLLCERTDVQHADPVRCDYCNP